MQAVEMPLRASPANEVEDMKKTVVRRTWRELSEAVAREQDPEKLLELVEQLNEALKKREEELRKQCSFEPILFAWSGAPPRG
jgi:hypothetical protein